MLRAVIYNRVSRDEQVENYSLGQQSKINREYADRLDMLVVDEYFEDHSGATSDRPEMTKVIDRAYNQEFDVLIVSDLDRFARGLVVQIQLEGVLSKNKVELHTAFTTFANTPEGALQKNIHAVFAEYERSKIKERMRRGKKGRAEAGNVAVSMYAKYGYTYVPVDKGGHYEINLEEAAVVKRVFEMFSTGTIGVRNIAAALSEDGIPTRADKVGWGKKNLNYGEWSFSTIAKMLKDETYTGVAYYNRTHSIKTKTGKISYALNPREDWIAIPIPRIIDDDLWEKVKRVREDRFIEKPKPTTKEYLVKNITRCAKCNWKLGVTSSYPQGNKLKREYLYYQCPNCLPPRTRAERIDDAVWEAVKEIIKNPDTIIEGLTYRKQEEDTRAQKNQDKIDALENRLGVVESQLRRLLDLFLSSDLDKELLEEKSVALKSEKQKIVHEIVKLKQYKATTFVDPEQILDLCGKIQKGIDLFDYAQKRNTLELLQVEVTYDFEEETIHIAGLFVSEVYTSLESRLQQWKHEARN